jgi:hypothetical protein
MRFDCDPDEAWTLDDILDLVVTFLLGWIPR